MAALPPIQAPVRGRSQRGLLWSDGRARLGYRERL